jgi:hypothetical protein
MSTPKLYRGENRLFQRDLFLENGTTPLLTASLNAATVELIQNDTVLHTYVRGTDVQLRDDVAETNRLILELTTAVSAGLTPGTPLKARWTLKVADADFEAEPGYFTDKQVEILANIL